MDRAAALQVLARMPPSDLAVIRDGLPPSWTRALRLARRDAAIRAAIPMLSDGTPSAVAHELARLLRRYAQSGDWRRDCYMPELPPEKGEARCAIHRILFLSRGVPLSPSQIRNVAAGHRG